MQGKSESALIEDSAYRWNVLIQFHTAARELHVHEDNLRYSLLKFFFVSVLAVFAAVDKLQLSGMTEKSIFIITLFFGIGVQCLLIFEHWVYLSYKIRLRRIEAIMATGLHVPLEHLTYEHVRGKKTPFFLDIAFLIMLGMVGVSNAALAYAATWGFLKNALASIGVAFGVFMLPTLVLLFWNARVGKQG